ncbi:MAG: putative molybdenum carrier protein [Deltaproteobacteria bacterium]|nr:putative molybdenum carrier protein [Deltaproteobacteria bacterium]
MRKVPAEGRALRSNGEGRWAIERIVSGGQTGVDRAALDAALSLEIPCGGWCPRGRRAEDGPIPARYPLRETPTARYSERTEWNVRDSDGTLVLHRGRLGRGTQLTLRMAAASARPLLVLDLSESPDPAQVGRWAIARGVRVLNVAGPRESDAPGLHGEAARFLTEALGPARGATAGDAS